MEPDIGDQTWGPASRRVGQRHQVEHPVVWRVVRPRRWWWQSRPGDGTLADLSVSGARLVISTGKAPEVGAMVALDLEGVVVRARVVRVDGGTGASATACGVTFLAPSPAFMAVVASLTGRDQVRPDYRD